MAAAPEPQLPRLPSLLDLLDRSLAEQKYRGEPAGREEIQHILQEIGPDWATTYDGLSLDDAARTANEKLGRRLT